MGMTGTYRHRLRSDTTLSGGFTLVDLLVSIAVIAVLIGILLPSLRMVHDTSRRVVCASNLRQVGLGVHMYASDNDGWLPPSSVVLGSDDFWGSDPMFLRIDGRNRGFDEMIWDGLGGLFSQSYLSDGRIFYCPSHTGAHEFETYAGRFGGEPGEIIANYQYRGVGPNGEQRLDMITDMAALVADGFREISDINHTHGMNVLRAGMSVEWFLDSDNQMLNMAMTAEDGPHWDDGWRILDSPPIRNSGFWDNLFP